MCPTSLDFGPRGWDRSGTYTWETPVIDDGNAVEAVTPPLTIAINLTLPAIGVGEVAGHVVNPEREANPARPACKAAAQATRHHTRRPSAKSTKAK